MSQSRLESAVEQATNIGSGFILAMIVFQFIILPIWGNLQDISVADNFWITCIFTVTSFARGYLWRRFFNWWKYHGGKEKVLLFFSNIKKAIV